MSDFFTKRPVTMRLTQDKLAEALQRAVRVKDPSGDSVLRMSFKDFQNLYSDFKEHAAAGKGHPFTPFSQYAKNLLCYADGSVRPNPVRPLLQNEMGTLAYPDGSSKIVVLKDAMPGDLGGAQVTVPGKADDE